MQTINHRPNLGIVGFGEKSTCQGVSKILISQLGEHLQNEFDIHIYGCRKEGIDETANSVVKRFYLPGNLNQVQSLGHKIRTMARLLRTSDLVLALGTKNSFYLPFFRLFPKKKVIVYLDSVQSNNKESGFFKRWWSKFSEKIAVRFADKIISEHQSIDQYLRKVYSVETEVIPMGGDHMIQEAISGSVFSFPDKPYALGLVNETSIAQTEMLLKALSNIKRYHMVLLGKWNATQAMSDLRDRYGAENSIHLVDDESMKASLSAIKKGAALYLHHHDKDSTHPILLEEMSMGKPVLALDTPINREITHNHALYYSDEETLIDHIENRDDYQLEDVGEEMHHIIEQDRSWRQIMRSFDKVLMEVYQTALTPKKEEKEEKKILLLEEGKVAQVKNPELQTSK